MELKTIGTKVKSLFDGGEDRGVSPVIGVILMVAITVILAAVIGAFVLGLGDSMGESAPQASIGISDTNSAENKIELRHTGGDILEIDDANIIVENDAGDRVVFENNAEGISFGPSDRITIQTTDGAASALTKDTTSETGDGTFAFDSNDRLHITIIDRPSGEMIFDTTIRA